MGWIAQGELLPELDAALFSLEPGQFSEPIQTRLGFHLVKVDERKNPSNLPVNDANQAVYKDIYQRKFQRAFSKWISGLRERAYIDVSVPNVP
jgi:peptidyl-prolyl cis-trans isomerase SurA